MKWNVELARLNVSEDVFDEILKIWPYKIENNIYSKFYGYKDRLVHYTNLDEYLICPTFRYNYVVKKLGYKDSIVDKDDNIQLILRKDALCSKPTPTLNGRKAFYLIIKLLKKYYSEEEIDNIFNEHSREYDRNLIQVHYTLPRDECNCIFKYTNVVKYDINKAHASAFINMFPKASKLLLKEVEKGNYYKSIGNVEMTMYYKNLFNYAVGYLCRQGYRNTYNYIVQSTTKLLLDTIDKCNGRLIYANTDSFAIQYPDNLLDTNSELGKFKLECDNDIYFYRNDRYFIYEYIDTKGVKNQIGSCLREVRDNISLKDGIIVNYNVDRSERYFDSYGKEHVKLKAINITKERLYEVTI